MTTTHKPRTTHEDNVLHALENAEAARRAFIAARDAANIAADRARAARSRMLDAERRLADVRAGRY